MVQKCGSPVEVGSLSHYLQVFIHPNGGFYSVSEGPGGWHWGVGPSPVCFTKDALLRRCLTDTLHGSLASRRLEDRF